MSQTTPSMFNAAWSYVRTLFDEEDPALKSKSCLERFQVFSNAQKQLVQEAPMIALVYAVAALVFGFPGIITLNPFQFVKASLFLFHGLAILHHVWNEKGMGGLQTFCIRAVQEVASACNST